jgi:hypothetical protein
MPGTVSELRLRNGDQRLLSDFVALRVPAVAFVFPAISAEWPWSYQHSSAWSIGSPHRPHVMGSGEHQRFCQWTAPS